MTDWIDDWETDGPVIPACPACGAPGDVVCLDGCENMDFRDAEFAGVTDPPEWPLRPQGMPEV